MWAWIAIILIGVFVTLLYLGRGYWAWVGAGALALLAWLTAGVQRPLLFVLVALAFTTLALLFGLPRLRQRWVSQPLMRRMRHLLPRMSDTERVALEAGTVWWDGEMFSGSPDWARMLSFERKKLSLREQAFLDGPVEQLCAMLDDWKVEQAGDLPPQAWRFIKEQRFFGMIIPESYGGLGFSALAHSAVITKLASRSGTAAVTVMVPNSLGPAELLLHYGTEAQKRYYLPRLASGEEIPCFALTGPEAGSDAAATQSVGIVCRGQWNGHEELGMRLFWHKRYTTLGPIATLIGLAFKLEDPDHLLGEEEHVGITCALIPARLDGIEIGQRHDPMGVPFMNGPTHGHDVFVPLDFIIGGASMAGQGWRMLMETLAAGRSISLPALSVGIAELAARVSGAYATVREQFNTPIGRFEGVEEPLARMGGLTYLMNSARLVTVGAVDAGERPSVISAVVKAYLTEALRTVINDAMDIRAGAAICRGPRNMLARAYSAAPIAITVEGANILTRSLIIYGQGVIRCHPFVRHEMASVATRDLALFDRAFFGHVNFIFRNLARAFVQGLTNGRIGRPRVAAELRPYLGHLTRLSAAFALLSDVSLGTLGGKLKRKEKISGRLADALAWLYLGTTVAKRYHDDRLPRHDQAFARWGLERSIFEVQQAMKGVLDNLPNRWIAALIRPVLFPLGARLRGPSDHLGSAVAQALLDDREERQRLTSDIYVPPADEPGLGHLEAALAKAAQALTIEAKIREAVRAGRIEPAPGDMLVDRAVAAGVITPDERRWIHDADEARDEVIQVDAFDFDSFVTVGYPRPPAEVGRPAYPPPPQPEPLH